MTSKNTANSLQRYIDAQQRDYDVAYNELKSGRKRSHWMWYIFPQIAGLGYSETSKHYAISSRQEAEQFLNHPVLGPRLTAICKVLLTQTATAHQIFGSPDDMKLKSSMTLFATMPGADPVFQQILDRFFDGERDDKTLEQL